MSKKMTIETIEHRNGSKGGGMYWGYVVGCDDGRTKLFYGKSGGGSETKGLHLGPFSTPAEAVEFANALARGKKGFDFSVDI